MSLSMSLVMTSSFFCSSACTLIWPAEPQIAGNGAGRDDAADPGQAEATAVMTDFSSGAAGDGPRKSLSVFTAFLLRAKYRRAKVQIVPRLVP